MQAQMTTSLTLRRPSSRQVRAAPCRWRRPLSLVQFDDVTAGLSNRTISKGNQIVLSQSYSGSTLSAVGSSGKSPDACYSLHEVWGPSYVEHNQYLHTSWNFCDKGSK